MFLVTEKLKMQNNCMPLERQSNLHNKHYVKLYAAVTYRKNSSIIITNAGINCYDTRRFFTTTFGELLPMHFCEMGPAGKVSFSSSTVLISSLSNAVILLPKNVKVYCCCSQRRPICIRDHSHFAHVPWARSTTHSVGAFDNVLIVIGRCSPI